MFRSAPPNMNNNLLKARLRLWFLFAAAIVLLVPFVFENRILISDPNSSIPTYLKNFQRGSAGLGIAGDYKNSISFSGLEPGDIILGGYPDCSYGEYSHAALYIGSNEVIEGNADSGIAIQSIFHFSSYSQVALLRIEAPAELKTHAVEYALAHRGKAFYPLAFKNGERIWNCSKIMWKAYMEQGIDLDPLHDIWVKPESFKTSPYARLIDEKKV